MAEYAFGDEVLETKRSRVLWRFIAGMNNDFIRQEVLRQKWMTAEDKPKEYDEVLNVAEEARSIQMGMRAAGPVTGIGVSDSSVPTTVIGVSDGTVLATQVMPSQRKPFQRMPGQMTLGGQSGQSRRNWMGRRGMECWYCHKIHPGGYRNCWRRARENPQWEPKQSQQRQVVRGAEWPRTAVVQACTYSSNSGRQFVEARKRLPKSPFISVTGVLDQHEVVAMLDTGAEFSLISASRLSKDMLKCLNLPSVVKCRGVGGEMVQVKGQIIRDIQLTGTQMEVLQLLLLVVEGLVVPVILGVDFLSKL